MQWRDHPRYVHIYAHEYTKSVRIIADLCYKQKFIFENFKITFRTLCIEKG